MDLAALTDVIAVESDRALAALTRADPRARVPTTPGWDAAALTWHLAQGQWSWGTIVAELLQEPDPSAGPPRPDADALPAFLAQQSHRLVTALRGREATDRCWSGSGAGRSVGRVARRQAHEALIHRVDAELTADLPVTPAAPDLADDGIEELVRDLMALPDRATFIPDGSSVRVDAVDTGSVWTLVLGRVVGTSPEEGTGHDVEAARLVADEGPAQTTATVSGAAWDLDRWLWGRLPAAEVVVEGDPAAADRLRAAAQVD